MMLSRRFVRSVLSCLLCLTVCTVPALAGNNQYNSGFIYPQAGLSLRYQTAGYDLDILNGYFPATFSSDDFTPTTYGRQTLVIGDPLPRSGTGFFDCTLSTTSQFWIEILYTVPAQVSFEIAQTPSNASAYVLGRLALGDPATGNNPFGSYVSAADMAFTVDSELKPLVQSSAASDGFAIPVGSYVANRTFGYRFYFNPLSKSYRAGTAFALKLLLKEVNITYTFSEPNYLPSINENVTVNTGILQQIDGTLKEIQTSTIQIQRDVSEIKDGLKDSNSSIWGAFKDSLSSLFVPSADDLTGLKDGFDQLAQDKLGGAYQTVDLVSGGVKSVTDKFKNPASSPGVDFPGISVPLGGDVGTVTLAASQTVTIPVKITEVLYPVSGVIIPIVCTIWTVRLGLDMVNCFMSGMSYGEFLHRHTSEEDDEV